MKRILYIFLLSAALISCKNSEEKVDEAEITTEAAAEENSEYKGPQVDVRIPVYRGEFILTGDAAVLKGKNFIYGVTIDTMARQLAAKVAPIKQDEYDMVPVVVQGILSKKPEGADGWDEILAIKNIISVSKEPAKADVKIEDKK